uniref:Uncharacterized protein n=1 Tax=Anopheles merus TaxID=30066 RepID=A0A182UMQ5_ANOME
MAWGYWSATAVDRGRSPRRNTQLPQTQYQAQGYQQPVQQQQQQQQQHHHQQQQYSLASSQSQQPQSLDSPQVDRCQSLALLGCAEANQLSDIICRATQPSIQSAGNTLTRGTSLRDTGDYAVPHPHPHTHHYMSTSATPPSLSRVGSCPGSTGGSGSGHGSGSGSSPGGGPGSGGGGSGSVGGGGGVGSGVSICGGSILGGSQGRLEYIECSHYDRMPLPIPVQIPIVPPPQLHSEDEIEPAYATGMFTNNPQQGREIILIQQITAVAM